MRDFAEKLERNCRVFGVFGVHGYIKEDVDDLVKEMMGSE